MKPFPFTSSTMAFNPSISVTPRLVAIAYTPPRALGPSIPDKSLGRPSTHFIRPPGFVSIKMGTPDDSTTSAFHPRPSRTPTTSSGVRAGPASTSSATEVGVGVGSERGGDGTMSLAIKGPPNCSTVLAAATKYLGTSRSNSPVTQASTTNA